MRMTFNEYIKNPAGKDNAVYSAREMFKKMYTEKYSKVMTREAGHMSTSMYIKGNSVLSASDYIIHLRVPSETVAHFFYDVVISFSTSNAIHAIGNDLFDYDAKFYSNDPAFVFTFAHSFIKNKMFFEDLRSKMSKIAIRDKAKIRNPKDVIGYVKTIYFAYLYMKDHGLNNKAQWSTAVSYNPKYLLDNVMPADNKVALRQEKRGEKADNSKPIEKKKKHFEVQGATSNITRRKGAGKLTRKANRVNKAKRAGMVNTVRSGRIV